MIEDYHKEIDELEDIMHGTAGRYFVKMYLNQVKIFGGIKEALLFERLFRWAKRGKDPDGWVYKTKEELEEETTMPTRTQDRVRKNLVELGVIEVTNKKPEGHIAPQLHYRINKKGYLKLLAEKGWNTPNLPNRNTPNLPNPSIYTTDDTIDNFKKIIKKNFLT